MRKRVLALALALTLLLSVPVSAAWSGLPRTGAAYAGQLSDVTKDSPFYENIAALNKELPAYSQIAGLKLYSEEFEKTPKRSIKRYLYQHQ